MLQLVAPFFKRENSPISAKPEHAKHLGIRAVAYTPDSSKLLVGFGEPVDCGSQSSSNMLVLCCALTLHSLWLHEGTLQPINGLMLWPDAGGYTSPGWQSWEVLVSTVRSIHRISLHSSGTETSD